ncbi:MAG: hypothetical protein AAB527_02680 [Patescibacteria group bacterium]
MTQDLFQKVRDLKLPLGKYALFGSAPLGIRGLRDCRDIDIIVTENLWNECKSKDWKIKDKPDIGQYLCRGEIELWKNWAPGQWNIKKLIQESEMIDGLPFVRLESVVAWKKLNGREKDLKDLKTIEKFLHTQK